MAAAAAAACARRAVGSSSLSNGIKSLSSAAATKTASATSTSARLSRRNLSCISRLPAELGCVQSLMPLHSAIATALLTSELSLKPGSWGWLSERAKFFHMLHKANNDNSELSKRGLTHVHSL